jgi:hypothetical protein
MPQRFLVGRLEMKMIEQEVVHQGAAIDRYGHRVQGPSGEKG